MVAAALAAAISLAATPVPFPRPSVSAEGQGPKQAITNHGDAKGSDGQTNKIPPAIPSQIVSSPENPHPKKDNAEKNEGGADWPVWIEAVSAAITGMFTVVLAIATVRLWNSTKGLHDETKRLAALAETQAADMKESIAAAKQGANAATVSADAAIGATRAWLLPTIDGDNLEQAVLQRIDPNSWSALIEQTPLVPEVRFHFDNHGKTPAFIREAAMELVISVGVPDRVLAHPTAPWWPEEIIVPAGGRYPLGEDDAGRPLERTTFIHGAFDDDRAKLFDAKNEPDQRFRFWFYGHVLYTDVWNNLHMTRFCLASEVWSGWYMPPEAMQFNQRT